MTYSAFLLAVLTLLLAPGPTNTLMALGGAQKGVANAVRLLPAELFGYLSTVLPLVWIGAATLGQWPMATTVIKLAAAAWVMYLAAKLWKTPTDAGDHGEVTARRVYVTTVLNPKALIFGLVLLPAPTDTEFMPKLILFCTSVISVGALWGMAGSLTRTGSGLGTRTVRRVASVWLAVVSVTLLASVLRV
jgi:threonine/homoserine/homoserine lactone efflux protein